MNQQMDCNQCGGGLEQFITSAVGELSAVLSPMGINSLANIVLLLFLNNLGKTSTKTQKGGNMLMPMGHDALLALATILLLHHFLAVRPKGRMLGGALYKSMHLPADLVSSLSGMSNKLGHVVAQKGGDPHLLKLQRYMAPLSGGSIPVQAIYAKLGELYDLVKPAGAPAPTTAPTQTAGARKKKHAGLLYDLEKMVRKYTQAVKKGVSSTSKAIRKGVSKSKSKSKGKRKSKSLTHKVKKSLSKAKSKSKSLTHKAKKSLSAAAAKIKSKSKSLSKKVKVPKVIRKAASKAKSKSKSLSKAARKAARKAASKAKSKSKSLSKAARKALSRSKSKSHKKSKSKSHGKRQKKSKSHGKKKSKSHKKGKGKRKH